MCRQRRQILSRCHHQCSSHPCAARHSGSVLRPLPQGGQASTGVRISRCPTTRTPHRAADSTTIAAVAAANAGARNGAPRRRPPSRRIAINVDVEQIMRDIRARISSRHGIDLTPQQIQELAARRLDAILEPRHVKPALLEQMRRAAGEPIEVPAPAAAVVAPFDESQLYASHRGFVQSLRRLLNPILKLFFNPAPIARALNAQAAHSSAAAAREAELYTRQAEWNALHYEIVQRLVTELARTTLESAEPDVTHGSARRQARFQRAPRPRDGARGASHQAAGAATQPKPLHRRRPVAQSRTDRSPPTPAADGARRRRRRRRGRRSGVGRSGRHGGQCHRRRPVPNPTLDTDTDDDDIEGTLPVCGRRQRDD